MFFKTGVHENFAKFAGNHLSRSPFSNKVTGLSHAILLEMRLRRTCFFVNFKKSLRTLLRIIFYRTPLVVAFVTNLYSVSFKTYVSSNVFFLIVLQEPNKYTFLFNKQLSLGSVLKVAYDCKIFSSKSCLT